MQMRRRRGAILFLMIVAVIGLVLLGAGAAEAQRRAEGPTFRQSPNAIPYALFALFTLAAVYVVFKGSKRL